MIGYINMTDSILLKQILFSITRHKSRSILAILGIFWGTLSVIMLMSLGDSFYNYQKQQMDQIADGKTLFYLGKTQLPYQGKPPGQTIHMRIADLTQLAKNIPGIASVTPILGTCRKKDCPNITSQNQRKRAPILGVDASYYTMQHLTLTQGSRFFNDQAVDSRQHVIVIGSELNDYLFPHNNGINQDITIAGIPFTIIGVIEPDRSGAPGTSWSSSSAFIPYTTYASIWGDVDITQAIIMPKNKSYQPELIENLRHYLARQFHFSPEDERALFIPDIAGSIDFFSKFFYLFKLFLAFSGAMTLAVGGIGVANIMFLIVSERTKEIGLYMALGAQDRFILSEVLLEAAAIIFTGGLLGILIAGSLLLGLNAITLPSWIGHPTISLENFTVITTLLLIIALLAGYFPAHRAINLSPITALHDEGN